MYRALEGLANETGQLPLHWPSGSPMRGWSAKGARCGGTDDKSFVDFETYKRVELDHSTMLSP
jgi:hypothetical protein